MIIPSRGRAPEKGEKNGTSSYYRRGRREALAHKCAQNPEVFTEIMLASRTVSKCDAIAASIKERTGRIIETARVNADDVPELVALIKRYKPVMVINVALPYQDLTIMDACLEAGVHYMDTANYEPLDVAKFEYKWQWAYQQKFKDAGLMALLGSGFDPGVTNVFAAYAQKHLFDEIHVLDIIDCNAGDHGQPFATNFNPEINIREVTAKGRYWERGEWVETDPLSWSMTYDFPDGIGPKKCFLMYHEELESLVQNLKGIRRARFWMTFSENYLNHLKVLGNVGMTGIEPGVPGPADRAHPVLGKLLPDPPSAPLTKGKTCIGCGMKGVKRRQRKVRLHLQHLRSRKPATPKSAAVTFPHHRRACQDRRHDDGDRQVDAARVWNMEHFDP